MRRASAYMNVIFTHYGGEKHEGCIWNWFGRFWILGDAKRNAQKLTHDELKEIEWYLEELSACNEEMWTETEINDMFWFQFEDICQAIGLDYDEVEARE